MKSFNKNTIREIAKTKNRFLSIFLICAIGVGFFSGVRATCEDMKTTADKFYDNNNLFDLRVLSSFGLTEDDKKALMEVDGVNGVFASKYTDLSVHSGEKESLTRVFSAQGDEINKIEIIKGRNIRNDGECLISCNFVKSGVAEIGEKVYLEDLTEAEEFPLKYKEYTVVGLYNTPMYISATQRGSTNIGDGSLDAFMIVDESDFTQDFYTEIYIKSDKLTEAKSYSDEYEKLRDELSEKLEELGVKRSEIRYNEVIDEAEEKLADGEKKLEEESADGQEKLDEAKAELENAKKEIENGEKELADAKKLLDEGKAQLSGGEKELEKSRLEIEEGRAEIEKNKEILDDAWKKLMSAGLEIINGEMELNSAKSTLDASKVKLDSGQAEIDKQKEELEKGKEQLESAKRLYETELNSYYSAVEALEKREAELKELEKTLDTSDPANKAMLELAWSAVSTTKATLERTKTQLDNSKLELEKNEAAVKDGEKKLDEAQKQIDDGLAQYNAGLAEYEAAVKEFAEGKQEYNKGLKEYNDGKAELDKAEKILEDGEKQYKDGAKTFEKNKAELEDKIGEYEKGIAEIADARKKYEEGLVEYRDNADRFKKEIAEAKKKLSDLREKLSDAGNAEWYVFSREDNPGYSEYESNAERINKISTFFPIFFLLVAGLVCLTTMSRMVEEQRTQIGTLKALGYSNGAIVRHYMIYAVSGALAGGVLGAFGGCILFPWVIMYAYSMMYNIRDFTFLFTPDNIILSVGAMALAIAVTVYFSCRRALEESPASLMRPKAPKAGKRILLEKIPFIWNKMNFFAKISGRNLFRYKRRMFMTVVGIAGCTALSLTGFGLKDSISDIVDLQYRDIYIYSGYLAYDEDADTSEVQSIYDDLMEYNPDTKYTRALIKQYETKSGGKTVQCFVTAVENTDTFEGFVDIHERVSREKLSIKDGAVITEKAAKLLGAGVGDEIELSVGEGRTKKVKISGITEQYAGHYLYIGEKQYEEIFGIAPGYNIVYFDNGISGDDEESVQEFSEKMLKNKNVLAVMMNATSLSSIKQTLSIMDLVTMVLIVSAGALALVVLYNLSNVNITERIREIATLKVLGFYDTEVSGYVFRENIVLSLMGGTVGLGLGYGLCMFVITTAELDELMFGRTIHPLSYVWAFLVTIGFSLLVNLIMTRTLKRVSMVESLKSVE